MLKAEVMEDSRDIANGYTKQTRARRGSSECQREDVRHSRISRVRRSDYKKQSALGKLNQPVVFSSGR